MRADHLYTAGCRIVSYEHLDHFFAPFVEVVECICVLSIVCPARYEDMRIVYLRRVCIVKTVVDHEPISRINIVGVVGECRLPSAGSDVEACLVGSHVVGVREREFVGAGHLSADFQRLFFAVFGQFALSGDKLVAFGVADDEYGLFVSLQAAVYGLDVGKAVLVERDGGRVDGLENVFGGTALYS